MKKDLKSSKHSHSEPKKEPKQHEHKAPTEGLSDAQVTFLQSVQGKSQEELLQEFYRMARKHVAQGTFDEKLITRMIDQLSPMLTPDQKNRMLELLSSVRSSD